MPTAQQLSDADRLYEHYFGDVADHAPRLAHDTTLKMFANGFALLSARGDDLAPSFEAFDELYTATRLRALQRMGHGEPPLVLRVPPPPVRTLRDPYSVRLQTAPRERGRRSARMPRAAAPRFPLRERM